MEINPKLRSIELTKLLEKYVRNTQERKLNQLNKTNSCYISLHNPSLYSNRIFNNVDTPRIQNHKHGIRNRTKEGLQI